jgi:hypothetical protein
MAICLVRRARGAGLAVWQKLEVRRASALFRCMGDVERRCRRDVRHQLLE